MYSNYLHTLVILCFMCGVCSASKILAFIPTGFYSHQAVWRPLWKELHKRGHEVTLVTTHPMKDPSLTNLTEIDISFLVDLQAKYGLVEVLGDDTRPLHEKGWQIYEIIESMKHKMFASSEIQSLIKDKNKKFDLFITEALYPLTLAFAWHYNCPWIGVASLDVNIHVHVAMGNPTHPILLPDYNAACKDYDNLSFGERITQTLLYVSYKLFAEYYIFTKTHEDMTKLFGPDLPPLQDIQNNASMIFLNINPLVHKIRPLNPNTIAIGSGIHIESPKELPSDIKAFIEEAKSGVVYFSLGSNIGSNLVDSKMRQTIIEAFRELPYRVLWKFDISDMENIPHNVKIAKWFPQQDILRHPNVKLFITQGGLQSLEESITFGVPFIGIPFFGDQYYNIRQVAKKGAGVELPRSNLNKTVLQETIIEVIENTRYREKAAYLGKVLHDRPMKGIEEAVWWTEYVLRHKGAKYLNQRSTIPLYQYLLLDVISLILFLLLISVLFIYVVFKYLLRMLCAIRKYKSD